MEGVGDSPEIGSTEGQSNLQLPNFTAIGQLGLGSALELGIWSLGFDTLTTTDRVHEASPGARGHRRAPRL